MRTRPGIIATAAVGVLVALARPALAQTAAELFDQNTIQEIRLSVNSRDLATLRANTALNTYYTADLTWKSVKVRNVGIRSRGQGSRNATKPGLRVDMARYTTGQTFVGLSTIILDNIWQDDALLRERLAFTLFEKMGEPAPRESFCRLFINNEYQGLYAITEEIDGDFARRVTGEADGTVFEFHWFADRQWRAEDLGDIGRYKVLLEPRTHTLDADSTLYAPIQQLFKEVNGPDDAVWRSRVEQYLDLNQFMVHVGIEQFIADNDGLLGAQGMNNFYLYRFQGTQKHRLFVWDRDQSFLFLDSPLATSDSNVLFRRAMTQPDLRETYLTTLERCAQISAADDFLLLEIDRLIGIIHAAAVADTKKQFAGDPGRFDQAVDFLRAFAARRPAQVLSDVARIRKGA
ncbi:MAG: CotH kinase family protein [Vicinamibacterales bacterium]